MKGIKMAGIYGKAKKRNPYNPGTEDAFAGEASDVEESMGGFDKVNVPDDPSKPPEFANPTQTNSKKPQRHPTG